MWRIATGFLVGYYLGTRAGREKFVELRESLLTIATSDTFHQAIRDGSQKLQGLTQGPGLQLARAALASPLRGQVVSVIGGLAQKALAAGRAA